MSVNDSLVTIIIPVYNCEKYLQEAVDSVLAQTYNNWELIIVNDASTDSTKEIATKYTKSDKRISLINHRKNKYRAGALNTGISKAKGNYICFLDADDVYFPNKTEKQAGFLNSNSSIDMVYGDMEAFRPDGSTESWEAAELGDNPKQRIIDVKRTEIAPDSLGGKLWGDGRIIPSCSSMIRSHVFDQVSFDEKLRTWQDVDLWL